MISDISVPAYGDATRVFQPCVGSFNFPATFGSPKFSSLFVWPVHTIIAVWHDKINPSFGKTISQPLVILSEMMRFGTNRWGRLRHVPCFLISIPSIVFSVTVPRDNPPDRTRSTHQAHDGCRLVVGPTSLQEKIDSMCSQSVPSSFLAARLVLRCFDFRFR
jgi:hypothetical protein